MNGGGGDTMPSPLHNEEQKKKKGKREMEDKLTTGIQGAFSAAAIAFMKQSVVAMIPWVMVMFAVIFCDLVFALRRCWLMEEPVRPSRALRATMGKCVTYFSFVLMVCMIDVAEGGTLHIERYTCLLVCIIELSSIISNILRPKGYSVDFVKMASALAKRVFGSGVEDIAEAIHKDEEEEDK